MPQLIDALFYDFDPLQGIAPAGNIPANPRLRAPTRISTVEIAIRSQAKRFLSHPLVVQQLEAIWAGSIVFHSAADTLHRKPPKQKLSQNTRYGTIQSPQSARTVTQDQQTKGLTAQIEYAALVRKSVSLYNPSDASPFKLSRLRVPRYRQTLSTLSYAIMLGLFLAVLVEHSLYITPLEIVFWFWSAGYMLDEIVGFTEQGFGLYILSVWNAFDIGILFMFMIYYAFRLYGILMPEPGRHHTANLAYDVLASTAVLLFPRLFSVLDHYRYFSQLMIAFRMMALDLIAILILIIIACSGFFVAFTLSFAVNLTPGEAAYALFQILMGFTPAAWEIWDGYNILGKAVLTLFLIICHFLIVTILITVLTNSFMAVVQNANEEHQFLFAVNTISMVKSDALFSYIAPANIIGWLLTPLRYVVPFRQFVKLNRTIIKITHAPLLFAICGYERLILSPSVFEPTDLVELRGRRQSRLPAAFAVHQNAELFSPGARLREPSVTTFHKDRALEEVFRRPFRGSTGDRARVQQGTEPNKSTNIVHDWMHRVGEEEAESPMEQPREDVERLEARRPTFRRHKTAQGLYSARKISGMAPSVRSDPAEDTRFLRPRPFKPTLEDPTPVFSSTEDLPQQTDQDGDDELATNEDEEHRSEDVLSDMDVMSPDRYGETPQPRVKDIRNDTEDYFRTPTTTIPSTPIFHTAASRMDTRQSLELASPTRPTTARKRKAMHARNESSGTILFSPIQAQHDDIEKLSEAKLGSPSKRRSVVSQPASGKGSGATTPGAIRRLPAGLQALTPAINAPTNPKPRPIFPPRNPTRQSQPNLAGFLALDRRQPSFNAMALDLASDLGDNKIGPTVNILEALPASFGTQMEMAKRRRQRDEEGDDSGRRLNKIMLARMSMLELGFAEVLREVKGLSRNASSVGLSRNASRTASSVEGDGGGREVGGIRRPGGKRKSTGKERMGMGRRVEVMSDVDVEDFVGAPSSVPEQLGGFGGDGDSAVERSSV